MSGQAPPAIRHPRAGRKAPRTGYFSEIVGPPECPLFKRWTLLGEPVWPGKWPFKLLVHHFYPTADDRVMHDHPRPFVTFVLFGSYDDMVPCEWCRGIGRVLGGVCGFCGATGLVVGDHMRAGMVRRRSAEHRHRTKVGRRGCWTLVVMGPLRRKWGFWTRVDQGNGVERLTWLPWRTHELLYGFGMRCEDDE